jgi:2,4-dienoyl-CoA reductase-like NADH-dependent reductase (Old Yellow Enzyme family)
MGLGVPVIAVNQLDRVERALEVLREKRATLVAVGRGLLADPDWVQKVREGRTGEIVACTGCDSCFDDLGRGGPVGCSQWK